MGKYVGLLRAVNVGGTGKLPMKRLAALCQDAGFSDVRTYIQSGNVVLEGGRRRAPGIKKALEAALLGAMGKPVRVLVRSADELRAIAADNPFPDEKPNQVMVLFMDDAPPADALTDVVVPGSEQLVLHGRQLYIHFPDGQGKSKLRIPFADVGTGRNLNTVRKLVAMCDDP